MHLWHVGPILTSGDHSSDMFGGNFCLCVSNGMIDSQTFQKQEGSKGNKTKHPALSSSKTERRSSTLHYELGTARRSQPALGWEGELLLWPCLHLWRWGLQACTKRWYWGDHPRKSLTECKLHIYHGAAPGKMPLCTDNSKKYSKYFESIWNERQNKIDRINSYRTYIW